MNWGQWEGKIAARMRTENWMFDCKGNEAERNCPQLTNLCLSAPVHTSVLSRLRPPDTAMPKPISPYIFIYNTTSKNQVT